ncbi:MAG: HEAT repeat domain-containing protein [Nitrospirota bacterium]
MQKPETLLKHHDVEVRREALENLRGQEGEKPVRLLLAAMEDSSWRVRNSAIDILLEGHPVEAYIHGLIDLLYREENAGARNSAIEALIRLNKKITPFLVEAFQTSNRDVRKFIIDVLGEFRDSRSLPLMLHALQDDDENVRVTAIEHLGKVGETTVVDALIRIVESDDAWTAYPATDALGRIGDRKAVPALLRALGRKTLRIPAIKALSLIADPATLSDLIPLLLDSSRTVREEVLHALVRFYHKGIGEDVITGEVRTLIGDQIFTILADHVRSSKAEVKVSAILLLGLLKDEQAFAPLLEISQDEHYAEDVKRAFVFIGREKPESLIPLFRTENLYQKRFICDVGSRIASPLFFDEFLRLVRDMDGHIRSITAQGLSRTNDPKAVAPITALLGDPYEDVQETAVDALARLGPWLKTGDFVSMLRDPNPVLRKNAALLLGKIGAKDAVPALGFALKDGKVAVRKACVEAFSILRTEESVQFLILALTDEEPHIRALAALSLGRIGGEGVFHALSLLVSDADDSVRVAVARSLGMLRNKKAVRQLVKLLADRNGFVVATAIESLSSTGGQEARDALLGMLASTDKEIIRTAIKGLSSFSGVDEVLLPFLKDSDWATRMAAVEALGKRMTKSVRREIEELYDREEDPTVKRALEEILGKNR